MDLVSILILIPLAAVSVLVAVRLPLAIMRNLEAGMRLRQALAQRIQALRMDRMLILLGLDREEHLHQNSTLEVRRQIDRCESCEAVQQCDNTLGRGEAVPVDELSFCPNIGELAPKAGT